MKLQRHTIALTALAVTLIAAAVVTKNVRASAAAKAAPEPLKPAPEPLKPALTVMTETPQRNELPLRQTANGTVSAWHEASIGAETHGLRLSAVHVDVPRWPPYEKMR